HENSSFSSERSRFLHDCFAVFCSNAGEERILARIAIPRGKDGTLDKEKSREIGEEVMDLVKDPWKTCGRAGSGRVQYDVRRHLLVVSHTRSGHEDFLHLLAALRNLFDREIGAIYALARPSHSVIL